MPSVASSIQSYPTAKAVYYNESRSDYPLPLNALIINGLSIRKLPYYLNPYASKQRRMTMSCFHPNYLLPYESSSTGVTNYQFLGPKNINELPPSAVPVPCGKCVGCRLDSSARMAERGLLELKEHKQSLFITLTYDDEHLPLVRSVDPHTGEAMSELHATLVPSDLQLFNKRLRKRFSETRIRFMAAGEYGDKNLRPHYHGIYFGLDLCDLVFYKRTELGFNLYTSEVLSTLWPLGFSVIGEATEQTIGYVARYITKKQTGKASKYYEDANIVPPFCRYSNKPGIGGLSWDTFVPGEDIHVSTATGGRTIHYPKYFVSKLAVDNPAMYDIIKKRRSENAKLYHDAIIQNLSIPYEDYLGQKEQSLVSRTKSLLRIL